MWFKFAPGATNITVEQQQFSIEYSVGPTNYVQAPSHFASKILAFKGYAAVEKPEGAPADKLKIDAKKEDEEAGLVMQVQELRERVETLTSDVVAATATIKALQAERAQLMLLVQSKEREIVELREEFEDKPALKTNALTGSLKKG